MSFPFLPVVPVYKISRLMKLDWLLKGILLPSEYKNQINELEVHPAAGVER